MGGPLRSVAGTAPAAPAGSEGPLVIGVETGAETAGRYKPMQGSRHQIPVQHQHCSDSCRRAVKVGHNVACVELTSHILRYVGRLMVRTYNARRQQFGLKQPWIGGMLTGNSDIAGWSDILRD